MAQESSQEKYFISKDSIAQQLLLCMLLVLALYMKQILICIDANINIVSLLVKQGGASEAIAYRIVLKYKNLEAVKYAYSRCENTLAKELLMNREVYIAYKDQYLDATASLLKGEEIYIMDTQLECVAAFLEGNAAAELPQKPVPASISKQLFYFMNKIS